MKLERGNVLVGHGGYAGISFSCEGDKGVAVWLSPEGVHQYVKRYITWGQITLIGMETPLITISHPVRHGGSSGETEAF